MSSVADSKPAADDVSSTTDRVSSDKAPINDKSTLKPAKGVAALAHTVQFYWFVGHLFVLIGSFNYLLSYIGVFSYRFVWYRTAYVAALVSYGISLFEKYFDVKHQNGSHPTPALRDENLQYFVIALLWLLTSPVLGSLVPFFIFALLHTLGYVRQHLLPALGYSENTGISAKLADFSRRHNAALVYVAATAELFLLFRLGLNLLLFHGFLKFSLYALFIRVRYETSRFTRQAVVTWEHKLDGVISNAPPVVKKGWVKTKNALSELPVLTGASSISGLEKAAETKASAATDDVGKSTSVHTTKISGGSNNTTGASTGLSENLRSKIEDSLNNTENIGTSTSPSFEKDLVDEKSSANYKLYTNDKLSTDHKPLTSAFDDQPSLETPSLGTPFDKSLNDTLGKPFESTNVQSS